MLMVRLLASSEDGAFNVGTGHATTVRSVVERVAAHLRRQDLLRFGAIKPSPNDPPILVADMSKVAQRLNWSAATSIDDGLEVVLAELRARTPAER